MSRNSNRVPRTQRYDRDTGEEQFSSKKAQAEEDAYQDTLSDSYVDADASAAPRRRRRSQAARIRGDEDFGDTIVTPKREEPAARSRYERPAEKPAAQQGTRRRATEDPYEADPYEADQQYRRPAKQPRQPADYDDYDEDDALFGEEEPPRKRRTVRLVVILVIVLALLATITYIGLRRPDFVEPVIQWGRDLIVGPTPTPEPTPEPTVEPTATPEPLPDVNEAVVMGFKAEPADQPDINSPVIFQVTTTAQTDRIQIVNDNGQVLNEGRDGDFEETDFGRVWRMMVYFLDPYEGSVEVYPGNEAGWNESKGERITIKVGSGTPQADEQTFGDMTEDPEGGEPVAAAGDDLPVTAEGVVATAIQMTGTIIDKNGEVESFTRANPVNMSGDNYGGEGGMNGVLTFRGNAMRQNAAYGTVAPTELKLEKLWSVEAGIESNGDNAFSAQPLIVQWHANVRQMMGLNADKLNKGKLKEVVFAGNNGLLYFFDLDDGSPTRGALQINPTMPMYGTPAIYPNGVPLMLVGSGDPDDTTMEADTGLIVYNMIKNLDIGILNNRNPDAYSSDASLITSPLIDVSSDTVLNIGGNGMLYTMRLNTSLDSTTMNVTIKPEVVLYRSGSQGDEVAVESSLAAYGEYVYYANRGGVLQCVNVNTMQTEWALQVGADTNAAVALAEIDGSLSLFLATKADVEAMAHLRRINAQTGEVIWDFPIPGTIMASPLVGTGVMDGIVVISVRNPEAGGTVIALDTRTGTQLWDYVMNGTQLSSPIAMTDGEAKAWVVQGDEGGLLLLDGLSGERVDYLVLDGPVYGAPAAFGDMIVVATQTGMLHGVRLK